MKDIFEYIKEIINTKDELLLFEFGMCDAHHSYQIMNMIPEHKVFNYHAFEPVQSLYQSVINRKKNYGNGNFIVNNKAIADKDGVLKFWKSYGSGYEPSGYFHNYYGSSSICKPQKCIELYNGMQFEEITTEAIKFDTYLKQNDLIGKEIDFVWADIQGAEHKLIKGGKNAFKQVRYFYTEYCGNGIYQGDKTLEDILLMLPDFEIHYDFKGDVLLKNKYL